MKRQAFSLLELLIVIVIIGVVYTLVVSGFNNISNEEEKLSLKNLKEFLQKFEYEKSVKLLCLDDCEECSVYVDGNKTTTIKDFLDKNVRTYTYDVLYGYAELEQEVFFNVEDMEERVCFSFGLDKSGVPPQILVEYKERFYDYADYFTGTKVYGSKEDAREAKEAMMEEVRR